MALNLKPYLREAAEDPDELDVKYLAGTKAQESRKQWAEQHLWWDQDQGLWSIPGTTYSIYRPGTVAHANHVAIEGMFPWVEKNNDETRLGLYLSQENLDWMPLWNPFRRCVEMAELDNVIDEDAYDEVKWEAIEHEWKEHVSGEAWDALAAAFQNQFRTASWQKDLIKFLESERGLQWFNSRASDLELDWQTESHPPSIDVAEVVRHMSFEDLIAQLYPEKNQPQLALGEPGSPPQLQMFEAQDDEEEISDFMRDIKRADPGQVKQFMEEHFVWDPVNGMYEMSGFCDFGGSLIDRANCEYFASKYPQVVETDRSGGYNSEAVGIRPENFEKMDSAMLDSLYQDLRAIADSSIIDENIYYRLESEMREAAWENWIKRLFARELGKRFEGYEDVIVDKMNDPKFRALFEDAREQAGQEWFEERDRGGEQSVHFDPVVQAVTEDMIQEWLFDRIGEGLFEQKHDYSVVMAPAGKELADAVLRWGQMFVTDEKLYIDDKDPDGFGRESDIHVTVKFGLHEKKPSETLLKIIEETQPFEIEVGPCSLFENELFDVVKFDVESQALRILNEKISQLENSDSHPDYHPHMTVAYAIKGTCRDLIGKPLFDENEPGALRFLVKSVTFRGADRNKITLFLGKPNVLEEADKAWSSGHGGKKFGHGLGDLDAAFQAMQAKAKEAEPPKPAAPAPKPTPAAPAPAAPPAKPGPPKGWVQLLPSYLWPLWKTHGVKRILQRVDEHDVDEFLAALEALDNSEVQVPPKGHWCLKMPGGYGIFGEGNTGASVADKRRILAITQQLVENPNMSAEDNRRWERARKAL